MHILNCQTLQFLIATNRLSVTDVWRVSNQLVKQKYPREVQSWENELDVLLTFLDDPSSIRNVIYTTNAIE